VSKHAVSVTAAEAEALRGWVRRERARQTIEVGLGYGVSAPAVCQALVANGGDGARHGQLPAVARASAFCTTNSGWAAEEVSPRGDLHQWVVLRTPATPPERPFDHFVDF
jgi:hypothetical protein